MVTLTANSDEEGSVFAGCAGSLQCVSVGADVDVETPTIDTAKRGLTLPVTSRATSVSAGAESNSIGLEV